MYEVDLEALKRDVRLAIGQKGPIDPCVLCGNRSPAHYCWPSVEARDRLTEWAGEKARAEDVPEA